MIQTALGSLTFSPLALEDRAWMDPPLKASRRNSLEYSFASNFIWRKVYKLHIAEFAGYPVVMSDPEKPSFIFPAVDGSVKPVVQALEAFCRARGRPLIFNTLLEADRARLEEAFPGQFRITPDRSIYDYLYESERMITLSGKKLSAKRNHINRFRMDNPGWSYEPITRDNIADAHRMSQEWCLKAGCRDDEELFDESCAVEQAFRHFFDLQLSGGLLRVQGRTVAFSIGEPLNDETYIIHIEKAFQDVQGAYQMINQLFAQANCSGYRYINREDDAGDEGLRKAKLSYDPVLLLEKSSAELISPL